MVKNIYLALYLYFFIFCCNQKGHAQTFVTIPDSAFANWLRTNLPTAMNGDLMNINSPAVTTTQTISVIYRNIQNLDGIQYFLSLTYLNCNLNQLTYLPSLPNTIKHLSCNGCFLLSLPNLPNSLITLDCGYNNLSSLPSIPNYCKSIKCNNNNLITLPTFPDSLISLECDNNYLTSISILPNSIIDLSCSHNRLTELPLLSNSLKSLSCAYNQLTQLPILPMKLDTLTCNNNQIQCFQNFPSQIKYIFIENNPFDCLPNYILAMDSVTKAYPLCEAGNPFGCNVNPTVISIPNIFTPNNDNINDVFFIKGIYLINFSCKIYDRWGSLIYQWADINVGWNGKINDESLADDGNYYFLLTYNDNTGGLINKKGFFQLLK